MFRSTTGVGLNRHADAHGTHVIDDLKAFTLAHPEALQRSLDRLEKDLRLGA